MSWNRLEARKRGRDAEAYRREIESAFTEAPGRRGVVPHFGVHYGVRVVMVAIDEVLGPGDWLDAEGERVRLAGYLCTRRGWCVWSLVEGA